MKRILILTAIFLVTFFFGCELGGKKEAGSCRLAISSHGGGFEGFYQIDKNDQVSFKQDVKDTNTVFYFYNVDFELPTTIYIYATGLTTVTDSVTVRIYKDATLLKENTVSNANSTATNPIVANTVNYSFATSSTTSSTKDSASE